jgi:PAS domain S-box-containing protein
VKPSIRKSLLIRIAALALGCLAITAGVIFYFEYRQFELNAEHQRTEHLNERKVLIKSHVQQAVNYIKYEQSLTESRLRKSIASRVHEAHAIMSAIHQNYAEAMDKAQLAKLITETLRPIRFNQERGYYFIISLDQTIILQPSRPQTEGGTLPEQWGGTASQSITSRAIAIAKGPGQGFFEYYWLKPDSDGKRHRKISYVKLFKPMGWLVGAGEYLEDVTKQVQAEVVKRLDNIKFGRDGYIFVGDWNGLSLAGPAKGRNMWGLTDVHGLKVVQELVAASKRGGGFVEYVLPPFEGQRSKKRISYAMAVPEWRWYVGTGLYLDDIEEAIAAMREKMSQSFLRYLTVITLIFAVLTFVVYLVAAKLVDRLDHSVSLFLKFFSSQNETKAYLDPADQPYQELTLIAQASNEMLRRRRLAEEELRKSEASLANIFRSSPIGTAIIKNRKFLRVNDEFTRIFGYSKKELKGQDTRLIYGSDEAWKKYGLKIYRQIRKVGFCALELKVKTKQGKFIDVFLRGSPTYPDDFEHEFIFTLMDITEHKRASRELKKSEERYRLLFDTNPNAVVYHRNSKILLVNPAAVSLLGANSPEDLIGLDLYSSMVAPDDVERLYTRRRKMIKGNGRVSPTETRLIGLDGRVIDVEIFASVVVREGGSTIQTVFKDITTRKKAEEALRKSEAHLATIFRAAPNGIAVMQGRNYLDVNDRYTEIVGYTREEIIGQSARMFFYDQEEYERIGREIKQQILEHGICTVETTIRHKNGHKMHVLLNTAPLDPDQSDGLRSSIFLDITEHKEAAQELARYQEHLEEMVAKRTDELAEKAELLEVTNAELSEFAYVVSHDLKAPLRAIHNYADFLLEDLQGSLDEEQEGYLMGLGKAVSQGENLVNDLLALSRVGRNPEARESLDLGAFVREVFDSLELGPDAELICGGDWPRVKVQPALLRQVLQNLITNAVKFNESSPKKVEVTWAGQDENTIGLKIKDNGLGIDPKYHARIFSMFQRLHTQDEYEGSGIGLALVKKAVVKLGGAIELESHPGRGSTFTVSLPINGAHKATDGR